MDMINRVNEVLGENEEINIEHQYQYKHQLSRYVFQMEEPSPATLDVARANGIPYVMNKLYELLANRSTGQQLSSAPFDVDYIRGLEDHWATQRRMQFWFNSSYINETEDVLEAYFHIYKRRAPQASSNSTHHVTVSLYKIINEDTMYNEDGSVGTGVELLDQQQVSAYTSQWIIFKNLKNLVREWTRRPSANRGLLITATDLNHAHVNGTHIDFVQKGENPKTKQPLFVVYTDIERKKSTKRKRRHRHNIDFLVENFLNEDTRQRQEVQRLCRVDIDNDSHDFEECTTRVLRRRRSLLAEETSDLDLDEEVSGEETTEQSQEVDDDNYDDSWEDDGSRRRRRLRSEAADLTIRASQRNNNRCQPKPLYISFRALGWGKWIIAPEGINANYCDGGCPFPLTSSLTSSNHAILQSVSHFYQPTKVKAPCCVPQKLARMHVLYNQGEEVVMKSYDNMIVETCGCR